MPDVIKDPIDIREIESLLPHRYPFLLVDRIIEYVPDERAIGRKNVTVNEPHFNGHFPGYPVMPGVLIIEAMAQTAALTILKKSAHKRDNKIVYFMSIESAKFRRPVVPGDVLDLHVKKLKCRSNVWKFEGLGKVNDQLCAEAVFTAMIAENGNSET